MNAGNGVRCPICASAQVASFLEIRDVPVHCNVPKRTKEDAYRVPTGHMDMQFCGGCGHIFNGRFDPALMQYTQDYESSLHFSEHFSKYAHELAERLIKQYNLQDKVIVEIACGKGEFIKRLCEMSGSRGIGFDPSYVPDGREGSVKFVQDFFEEHHAQIQADIICCRHALEHMYEPRKFVELLGQAVAKRAETVIYLEVPNVRFTLEELGIWDLIYEHYSYFSDCSLQHLFRSAGMGILKCGEAFDRQFLYIEAGKPAQEAALTDEAASAVEELRNTVERLGRKFEEKVAMWESRLTELREKKARVVVWGGGSKGVTFLNILARHAAIEYVVDVNPRKQDMYIAGTGQRIVPPHFLSEYRPDTVIVMNPVYVREVGTALGGLGVTADLLVA